MRSFVGKALPSRVLRAVAGRNLFEIAAHELGDAAQWNRIAALNGLTDPWVTTPTDIKIPAPGTSNGGILGI